MTWSARGLTERPLLRRATAERAGRSNLKRQRISYASAASRGSMPGTETHTRSFAPSSN